MDAPEIVTEGTGWFEQPGDRAELDVGFSVTARTRSAAVAELGARVAAAPLAGDGVEVRHRRLWVHNEWRKEKVVGCRAGEDVALLVTDPAVLESLLSGLIAAEPTSLSGPRWVLADPAAARREAQARAVTDARDRALGYVAALGGRLGPLRRLSEVAEPDHGAPRMFRMAAAESADVPDVRDLGLEPEPVRITVRCTTTWSMGV